MTPRVDSAEGGFTLAELLIAAAITLGIAAAMLGLVQPAQRTFQAQPEISDMHQRLRAAIDALSKDLLMAGAGLPSGTVAPVVPYRLGRRGSDPGTGVFYRPDMVTARYVPAGATEISSHTYYLRADPATNAPQLMHYDGAATDAPVVDHVVSLGFEYFDAEGLLDAAALQDGPWTQDTADAAPFDEDLLRIRRIRVRLRVEAALASMRGPSGPLFARGGTSTAMERYLPDRELRFDIALRQMNGKR